LKLEDLLYFEAKKDYVQVLTGQQSWLTHMTMKAVEESLPAGFIRVHRSFIVAKRKIESFSSSEVEIHNKQIPIGRHYKDQVLAQFKLAY